MDDHAAIAELLEVTRNDPSDARSRLKLADLYAQVGDFPAALSAYEWVAKFYGDAGYVVKAVSAYKQIWSILKGKAPDQEARYGYVRPILVDMLQRVGLAEEAATVLEDMATSLQREHRDEEAVDLLKQAVELSPGSKSAALRLREARTHTRPTMHDLAATALPTEAFRDAPPAPPPPPPPAPAPSPRMEAVTPPAAPVRPRVAPMLSRRSSNHTRPTLTGFEAVTTTPPSVRQVDVIMPEANKPLPPPPEGPAVPVLETPRLRLRGYRIEADFAASLAMWSDANVTRFVSGRPFTGEEVWARLLRYAGLWASFGIGSWAIEERVTGKFVGEVGFGRFKREFEPPIHDAIELNWAITMLAQGQGFATEALAAALEWADGKMNGNPTACIIEPGNLAAIAVSRKVGYKGSERRSYHGTPVVVSFRA